MKKLLVIGGTGFIGYHVIKEAKKRNWNVTSISLSKPKKKRFNRNVNYKIANINNYKLLKKKISDNYDFVINAGGYGKHPDFNKSGEKLFESHFLGLVNLTKIISRKRLKKFIQIGSSAEYGKVKSPQIENSQCIPNTPYALAKFSCTDFLQNLYKANRFPASILRFYLVYGPQQDKNRIISELVESCLKNRKFPTTKGDQLCDFCFIDDAVRAIFKTLISKKTNGKIINIGYGKPIKIKKVISLVSKLIGKGKPQFGKLKYRKGTNMKLFPSINKAKKIIRWKPEVKFIDGLKLTINSHK